MLIIYAKPGTHPARYYRVYRKRSLHVDTVFKAKPVVGHNGKVERYAHWEGFRVIEIRGGLFFLERW
jgi:hypothetical protein